MENFFWGLSLLFLCQNLISSEPFEVNCENDSKQFENSLDFETLKKQEHNSKQLFETSIQELLKTITQTTIQKKSWFVNFAEKITGTPQINRPKTVINYNAIEQALQKTNFRTEIKPFINLSDVYPRIHQKLDHCFTSEENKEMGKELADMIKPLCEFHRQTLQQNNHELFFELHKETGAIGHIINAFFQAADQIYQTYPLQKEEVCIK